MQTQRDVRARLEELLASLDTALRKSDVVVISAQIAVLEWVLELPDPFSADE